MTKPKMFIGSSQRNLQVATLLAENLEPCAEVTVWNEGVFGLNQGYLESLLESLEKYDFAGFVLAPDDVTTSKGETAPSPRDNVLFESGLFLGALGRGRVFLISDQAVELKIPSDLAGVTLAFYDGSRIEGSDAAAAVRTACRVIRDKITASRFPNLVGEWRSRYPMTAEEGNPMIEEDVEIRACRDGLAITSINNPHDDSYTAYGREMIERQLAGRWESAAESTNTCGLFVLTVHPSSKYMYGYFTSPDMAGGTTYATWVLAKKAGVDEAKINERLKRAEGMLAKTTVGCLSGP